MNRHPHNTPITMLGSCAGARAVVSANKEAAKTFVQIDEFEHLNSFPNSFIN
jgi:hypothetical protein